MKWKQQVRIPHKAICLVLGNTDTKIQKQFWPSEQGWKLHTLFIPFFPHKCQFYNQMKKKKKKKVLNSLTFGHRHAGFTSLLLPAVPLMSAQGKLRS